MPDYGILDGRKDQDKRIIERLLQLRKQLDREIPQRTFQDTLLLATWNIREFDSPKYGDRVPESYYYIAEIIDRFDLVAVQEVNKNLDALYQLCKLLGESWKYLVTDTTEGSKGNNERMAFLYDSRKIRFGGLASQLVLPPVVVKNPETGKMDSHPVTQIARTPLMAGFTSGWTDFILTTVHIIYGQDKANDPERVEEIRQVAQYLKERTEDPSAWARNLILLGDFNIYAPEDDTMKALTGAGFEIPKELQKLPSNAPQTKFYDQIAFRVRPGKLDTTGKAGVFNFFQTVFREKPDEELYIPLMGAGYQKQKTPQERSNYYKQWRTFQMSDHLPMWVELKINYADNYLKNKLPT
ncbi:MAG: endonuclease/exonuclease/phosphatase family protein [Anaerolineae bacterium]|nr:endonuclease/exonuclease/phosphatase family protein [Anaerolineae bacterium]